MYEEDSKTKRRFLWQSLSPKEGEKPAHRLTGCWPFTKQEYGEWRIQAWDARLLPSAIYALQNILAQYYETIFYKLDSGQGGILSSVAFGLQKITDDICMELLSVIGHGLAAHPQSKDKDIQILLPAIFRSGLAAVFSIQAFSSRETGAPDVTTCPFRAGMGKIWNTELTPDENGVYQIQPNPKPSAMPVLLAKLIAEDIGLMKRINNIVP